jgi:hypothetical protein
MHDQRMALSPSVWADLDALVLEEVNALDAPGDTRNRPAVFSSEDDFVAQAAAYLRQRAEPHPVIDDLIRELGLSMSENLELPDDLEPPQDPALPQDAGPPEDMEPLEQSATAEGLEAPAAPRDAATSPRSRPGS